MQFPETDGVVATQIMIVDTQPEKEQQKEEVKLSSREIERKREAKLLEKQRRVAERIKQKAEVSSKSQTGEPSEPSKPVEFQEICI